MMQDDDFHFRDTKGNSLTISNREQLEEPQIESPIIRSLRFFNYLNEIENSKDDIKDTQSLSKTKLDKINKKLHNSLNRVNLTLEALRNIIIPLRYREEKLKQSLVKNNPFQGPKAPVASEQEANGILVIQETIIEQSLDIEAKKINFYKKKHYLLKAKEILNQRNIQKRENTKSTNLVFKELLKIKGLGFKINFSEESLINFGRNENFSFKLEAEFDKFSKYVSLFSKEKTYHDRFSLSIEHDKSKEKSETKVTNYSSALTLRSPFFKEYNKDFELSVELSYGEETIIFGNHDMQQVLRSILMREANRYFSECEQYLKELSFYYYYSMVYFLFKICKIEINAANGFLQSNILQYNDITIIMSQVSINEYSITLKSYDFLQITFKIQKRFVESKEGNKGSISNSSSLKKEFLDFNFSNIDCDFSKKEKEGQVTAMFIKHDSRLTNTANSVKKFYKKYIERLLGNVFEKMKYTNNFKNFLKNVLNNQNTIIKNPKQIENYFNSIEKIEDFDFDLMFEKNLSVKNNNFNIGEMKKNFVNSTFILCNLIQLEKFILRKIVVVSLNKKIESYENFDCSNSFILTNGQNSLTYEHTYFLERTFNIANDQNMSRSLQFSLIFSNDKIRIEFIEEFLNKLYFCENSTFTEKNFDFMNYNYLLKHLNNFLSS